MSIRPVDFQLSIPRTTEVSKIKGEELNKEAEQQQLQMGDIHNKADNSLRQVQKRDKAEDVKIREKEEKKENENKGQGHQKDSNKQNASEHHKNDVEKFKTSTIDIKI